MRIMIKGGVWKNTEDEILKAAVMKYGKNQWARVASLLNRKSAKQCKARWYEWLDPSIKKTEWTRDEEEKLLHLAKLYPCQWRTVAPLVGRTAAQCMEKYEKLLDDAERELGGDGGDGAGGPEEVRRLRPGEIDPNPEVRPARPDPVDMDEDEKEMLSEARARLANTRGKKAKRKAREAQLDEARRLASLQKKRELKAAGIYTSRFGGRQNKKYMDYDAEVPFQKLAPAGFYDVTSEKVAAAKKRKIGGDADFEAIRLDRFEEQRRDAAEKIAQRDDRKKVAKLMKANLPQAVANVARLNDPEAVLRRSELSLPAPQVTDEELEEIAKLGGVAPEEDDAAAAKATQLLLGDGETGADVVANLLASARARTPAVPRSHDSVAQEARNAVVDRDLQTPLLGEDQAAREDGTGYAGATPRSSASLAPTPSALSLRGATPLARPTSALGAFKAPTPLAAASDADPDSSDYASTTDASSVAGESDFGGGRPDRKRLRLELKQGLDALPAPKFAYDVDAPADEGDEGDEDVPASKAAAVPLDAADRDALRADEAKAAEQARLALVSSAVKRDLPRPRKVLLQMPEGTDPASLIRAEMVAMLLRDAHDHPVKGGPKKVPPGPPPDPRLDHVKLDKARALVAREAKAATEHAGPDSDAAFEAAWNRRHDDVVYFPSTKAYGKAAACDDAPALVGAYKASFEATRAQMAKGATRAARIEARVSDRIAPLCARADALREDIANATADLDQAAIEVDCYIRLHRLEQRNLPARLQRAKARVARNDQKEKALQQDYVQLKRALAEQRAEAGQKPAPSA